MADEILFELSWTNDSGTSRSENKLFKTEEEGEVWVSTLMRSHMSSGYASSYKSYQIRIGSFHSVYKVELGLKKTLISSSPDMSKTKLGAHAVSAEI